MGKTVAISVVRSCEFASRNLGRRTDEIFRIFFLCDAACREMRLCDINTMMSCAGIKEPRSQREVATLEIDRLPLVPGRYPIALSVSTGGANGRRDFIECAAHLEVTDSDIYGSGASLGKSKGVTYIEGRWRIEGAPEDSDD